MGTFQQQLQVELDRVILKSSGQSYLLGSGSKPIAIGQSKGDDIRKTDDKGRGYQPMISGFALAKFGRRRVDSSAVEFRRRSRKGVCLPCGTSDAK